ncbi:hypothetical protein Leryth_020511 [Lithospermum erythrorhizon]|nr:hypothetical protein Leryth_020511 [Lithospermum erythrorhizon]
MQMGTVIEVTAPSPLRYMMGAAIMMMGVVFPLTFMMFRNKRPPSSSSSSYAKHTFHITNGKGKTPHNDIK